MATLGSIISFLANNLPAILKGLIAIVGGLLAVAVLVPGDQPDSALKAILAFIQKFSGDAPDVAQKAADVSAQSAPDVQGQAFPSPAAS